MGVAMRRVVLLATAALLVATMAAPASAVTDEELYDKYGITEEERAYIAELIREMPT